MVVLADVAGKEEFMEKKLSPDVKVTFIESLSNIPDYSSAGAFFILKDKTIIEDAEAFLGKPVFINSIIYTLQELKLPENFIWSTSEISILL